MTFLCPAVVIGAGLLLCSCDGQEQPTTPVSSPPDSGEEDAAGAPQASAPDASAVENAYTWPDPPADLPDGTPVMVFAKARHDFGAITDAGTYTASFPFKNTGTGTLVISDVKAGCGCTIPKLDKREFLPGEVSTLDIVFDPTNLNGSTINNVSVVSNSLGHGIIRLAVGANLSPLVRWNSTFLRLQTLEFGKEHSRTFSGICTDPNLKITGFTTENPDLSVLTLSVSPIPRAAGGQLDYRVLLQLTVADTAPWGRLHPIKLTLTARGSVEPGGEPRDTKYNFLVYADLYGDLRVDPYALRVGHGLSVGQPFDAEVVLSSVSGTYFAVVDASVDETTDLDAEVQVEPIDPASYRISIHGTANTRGGLWGEVRVRTDVPGEEDLTIRIEGYVK
jgi:hypothetical protein